MLLLIAMTLAEPLVASFPERTPVLIEACLEAAVETGQVTVTEDSHKYICAGEAAENFWSFLEAAKLESYEQDAGSTGHWLGREFPLGGCFKRVRLADGSRASSGLSCTVWIPRARGTGEQE
jgi:hypothetical protein